MIHSKLVIFSEDPVIIEKTKSFAVSCGIKCEVRRPEEDGEYDNRDFGGEEEKATKNNVVFFPRRNKVSKMNELEALAIQQAIRTCNGNLTEAAKALGIGRATLYRKVKLYNIMSKPLSKNRIA